MAIATDASSLVSSGGFSNSLTTAFTVSGTDRLLLVGVSCATATADVTSVTYNGTAMTLVGTNENTGVVGIQWYRLVAPATGTNNVVVSLGAFRVFSIICYSLTGVDQTTPIEASDFSIANLDGFGTSVSTSITTVSNNARVVTIIATKDDAAGFVAGGSATMVQSGDDPNANLGGSAVQYLDQPTAGATAYSMSWTTSTNWRGGTLALKAAAAAVAIPWWQPNAFFWFPNPSSGGSTYNESTDETAAITDAQTGLAVFPRSVAETAAATDAQTGLLIIAGSTSESAVATDTPAAALVLSTTVAETAAATDTPAATLTIAGTVAESAAATDSQTGLGVFTRDVAESAAVTDTQSAALAMAVAVAESMAAADTQTGGLFYAVTIDETMSIADTQTGLLTMLADRQEVMSIADTQSAVASFVVAVTETVAATESSSAVALIAAAVAETIAASDTQTGGLFYAVTVDESVAITDTTSVQVTLAGSVAEAVAIADASNTVLVAVAAVVESIATQDIQSADGPPPSGDEFRVGGGSVADIVQTLNVATIYHTQKKTGPS